VQRVAQQRDRARDGHHGGLDSAVPPSTAREIHSARIPSALASIAASTLPVASWECGRSTCPSRPITPGLLA
jgi:hypothetical protein